MKRKIWIILIACVFFLTVFTIILTTLFFEPWFRGKIQAVLNKKYKDYTLEIGKVHFYIYPSGIELEKVTIISKKNKKGKPLLNGEISSLKLKGINFLMALFENEINIKVVTISNCSINGEIPHSKNASKPEISPIKIKIGKVFFNKINLAITDSSFAKSFSMKEGILKLYNLHVEKNDTLTPILVNQFDFEARELLWVSPDSIYTYSANNIIYSGFSNTLAVKEFSVHPNYKYYDFTARFRYETDRFDAVFSNIYVHGFSAAGYFKSNSLVCSYIEIGKMELDAFRDKRKEFEHINKTIFQDMIYKYPGIINIDSVGILSGNIIYREHDEKANEAGYISFNKLKVKIYKISNHKIYKTKSATLEVNAEALLMGKSKFTIKLKSKIFDIYNTFSVSGTLSRFEAKDLNPILEKNAFVYATSGKINAMQFNFNANNAKATGTMTLYYDGLNLSVKNSITDDTTAFKERIVSILTNIKVLNSNPLPKEELRVGIIDYDRDPEKSLINYCFKSVLSGVKSSITKKPKQKKKP